MVLLLVLSLSVSAKTESIADQINVDQVNSNEVKASIITPDNPWYGLKRVVEDIDMAFTFDKVKKAEKAIAYADERLVEIEAMGENAKTDDIERAKRAHESALRTAKKEISNIQEQKESEKSLEKIATLQNKIEAHEEKVFVLENVIEIKIKQQLSSEQEAKLEEFLKSLKEETKQAKELLEQEKRDVIYESDYTAEEAEKEIKKIEEEQGLDLEKKAEAMKYLKTAKISIEEAELKIDSVRSQLCFSECLESNSKTTCSAKCLSTISTTSPGRKASNLITANVVAGGEIPSVKKDKEYVCGDSSKVFVCHSVGNGDLMTLEVSKNAAQAHVDHGDVCGPCEDFAVTEEDYKGSYITSIAAGNTICEEEFGENWEWVEFHEQKGWGVKGTVKTNPSASRAWVWINDQNSECFSTKNSYGMTWDVSSGTRSTCNSPLGLDGEEFNPQDVSRYTNIDYTIKCNAYTGDTPCSMERAVLCVRKGSLPVPIIVEPEEPNPEEPVVNDSETNISTTVLCSDSCTSKECLLKCNKLTVEMKEFEAKEDQAKEQLKELEDKIVKSYEDLKDSVSETAVVLDAYEDTIPNVEETAICEYTVPPRCDGELEAKRDSKGCVSWTCKQNGESKALRLKLTKAEKYLSIALAWYADAEKTFETGDYKATITIAKEVIESTNAAINALE